jgi:outer membrane receptor protein involved in Fe transport
MLGLLAVISKNFANPDIKWEETAMTNVGIDFMAFNNRLSLTADYYVKNTKDILLTVPIPISSGGANDPIRNAGKIRNNGFEFNLGWMDQPNPDISYGINLIGSFNKNKVIAMGSESGSTKTSLPVKPKPDILLEVIGLSLQPDISIVRKK